MKNTSEDIATEKSEIMNVLHFSKLLKASSACTTLLYFELLEIHKAAINLWDRSLISVDPDVLVRKYLLECYESQSEAVEELLHIQEASKYWFVFVSRKQLKRVRQKL